jgi:16S rRNA G966 N2-methylase RsmD
VVGLLRDESVDLIYLDPPFNSKASYNVLFKAPTCEHSQAIEARYIASQTKKEL